MSQPPVYNRTSSFTNLQAVNPTGQPSGLALDVEFNAVKAAIDAIEANLALLQRDDGALANASVGLAQLSPAVTIGFSTPTAWLTGTTYVNSPAATAFVGGKFYSCLVSHTSGTFATDLAAGKWVLIADLTAIPLVAANQIAVTASGLLTTNVQTSLQALDAGKAATSHTHPASAISDSTAAGRAMLLAANLAAQQTLLGLGLQAYVNSPVITAIANQIALTGKITPAALAANTNNWSPTGWATSAVVEVSASVAINLTGFSATTDGDLKIVKNVGATYTITLTSNDTSSAAANRLLLPRPVTLWPGQTLLFEYHDGTASSTSSGWKLITPPITRPVVGTLKNLALKTATNTTATAAADEIVLEDATGETWRTALSATVDLASNGAVNKLDAGTIASATFYYFWAIGNPTTNVVGALASTSASAPTMPSGFTFKAYLGAIPTASGSAQLMGVWQLGRKAQYILGLAQTTNLPKIASGAAGTYDTTAPTWAAAAVGAFVPSTASFIAVVASPAFNAGTPAQVMVAPNSSYGGYATSKPPPFESSCYSNVPALAANAAAATLTMLLESTNIYWVSSSSSGAIFCLGWEDHG